MFEPVISLKKYIYFHSYDTTNWTFKIACRLNVTILLFFVVLMSAKQFFGEPIDCVGNHASIGKNSLETYCWIMGIFVQEGFTGILTNRTISKGYVTGPITGNRIYLRYYQWLPLIYLGSAVLFMTPYAFWKRIEGGRIRGIVNGLETPLFKDTWTPERRSAVMAYFLAPGTRRVHSWYALKYFGCQVLLLLISILNIWIIDTIFGGFWVKYYNAVKNLYDFNYEGFVEATAMIFPRMAKCEYTKYGPSGSNELYDALCLLPFNIVNEKVFAFLFFWLLLMALITAWGVIYGLLVISSSWLRIRMLSFQANAVSIQHIKRATNNGACGEFFILHLIGKNVSHHVFNEILMELSNYMVMGGKFEEVDA